MILRGGVNHKLKTTEEKTIFFLFKLYYDNKLMKDADDIIIVHSLFNKPLNPTINIFIISSNYRSSLNI